MLQVLPLPLPQQMPAVSEEIMEQHQHPLLTEHPLIYIHGILFRFSPVQQQQRLQQVTIPLW